MATTTWTPNLRRFSTCLTRLHTPRETSSVFSLVYASSSWAPGLTGGPPPCILSARMVATITAALGTRPDSRHFMLKNFSAPMSAPKPASVMTMPSLPASCSATRSATIDELPMAMLAKGPACTRTGVPSSVCIIVGLIASFMSTVMAPAAPMSSAVTGSPDLDVATTMRPMRFRMSCSDDVSARMAMTSDATAMSKLVERVRPFSVGAWPMVTPRSERSFVSMTRYQLMVSGSMSRRTSRSRSASARGWLRSMPSLAARALMGIEWAFPLGIKRRASAAVDCVDSWYMRVSMAAARRLFAATTAWMSPVMWRLNSAEGITCAYPPPFAPPLREKTTPWAG
mmetsp:Transcript_7833/g.25103  ORF Transcript_7833/g.25103 Transcript_7833/m.25103 type:complete len:341 (-) Transcript_7833:461-1483(-)